MGGQAIFYLSSGAFLRARHIGRRHGYRAQSRPSDDELLLLLQVQLTGARHATQHGDKARVLIRLRGIIQ